MVTANDRSHESIINDTLARLLRDECGLSAVAETLRPGARPDIIVRSEHTVVVVETELEPAPTVEADALARLGMEIDGQRVENVFAVTVPGQIRSTPQQQLYNRLASAQLAWQEWRIDGSSGPATTGRFHELGQMANLAVPTGGDLDEAVDLLDKGVRRAGQRLSNAPGTLARVSDVFGADPNEESANMAALVIINAMVFQERLASSEVAFPPVGSALRFGKFSRERLLQAWDQILEIDYYPIFGMARDVVDGFTDVEAPDVLGECHQTAADLLATGMVGRHDLSGRIFNRLISERKLLAAFYTSIPASTLLAGLSMNGERWTGMDWSDAGALDQLRVVDPACGTGTLLMAAYRQIVQNHTAAVAGQPAGDLPLHKLLVERVIIGADVVQSAIHMTAATLAAMSPLVRFEQMQLHTLYLDNDPDEGVRLGSLDWLKAPEAQAHFSSTLEQIGAKGVTGTIVQRPVADLVISNPPYTRRGADGGQEDAIARVFDLPQGDTASQDAIKKQTSALLKGTPANQIAGHGSSFTVLADRLVNPGGRIALVLPATALTGESWQEIRAMLSAGYEVEFVVSSHDPDLRTMSYDTGIAEGLLVARKLRNGETPSGRGRFVNLWRAPRQQTDSLALVSAINKMASRPVHLSDGPPVGGSPIIIGGELWGEMVEGPLGGEHWKASRWKRALTCQFASAVERGEFWNEDGTGIVGTIPVAPTSEVCHVGPQHRQIRGSLGAFDGHHGWQEQAQYPAIWSLKSSIHNSMSAEPNAYLVPKPGKDHSAIWSQSGTLHATCEVRYNSQPIMATRTPIRTLGVRTWFTLRVHEDDPLLRATREIALACWCNSTLGLLLHANHSNRSQDGRGIGNKGMLETLTTLDVRKLADWQLHAAQGIWHDFSGRAFRSFHECAIDPARIELDERVVRELLGLGEDAVVAVARLRALLAGAPSIHGSKEPQMPK